MKVRAVEEFRIYSYSSLDDVRNVLAEADAKYHELLSAGYQVDKPYFDVDHDSDYYDSVIVRAVVCIVYHRDETAKEKNAREQREKAAAKRNLKFYKQQYEEAVKLLEGT